MLHFVYEEVDPHTDIPGYVGITNDPNTRHEQHLDDTVTNAQKIAWIQGLLEEGMEPKMHIIEVVEDRETARERERYWIQAYLERGYPLTNIVHAPQVPSPSLPAIKQNPPRRMYTMEGLETEWNKVSETHPTFNDLAMFFDMHDLFLFRNQEAQDTLDLWWEQKRQQLLGLTTSVS